MVISQKEYIYLICIVVASSSTLLLFLIVVVFNNVRLRKQKEIDKLQAVIQTQENERQRIAADMHDEIGPLLSAVKLQIGSLEQNTHDSAQVESIRTASNQLNNAIQNIRSIVRNLSLKESNKPGLRQCIEDYKGIIEANGQAKFELVFATELPALTDNAEANIYRILSELINNSIKHSSCNLIQLKIISRYKKLEIYYRDNGKGLPHNDSANGMGIRNIYSRVNALSGNIKAGSDFNNGAEYSISFDISQIT